MVKRNIISEIEEDCTNFYDECAIEELLDSNAISPEEEAFMRGYEEAG